MEGEKNINRFDKHSIKLDARKKLELTGVVEVISFSEESVTLETCMGGLLIKGSNMKVSVLNVENGDMCIDGFINSLAYVSKDKTKKESILKKMFK
ncbi:sporulation protein YabP [Clostridium cylindrosporum]|uniref:Sporulation protein YabP n=1 Tax=Clostridium cylindrosporum DSM 605 TaxID=1121307 RepID=A0A0J8G2W9_CLOCY|nr:sporulation protein YabP [Clostridium cylindrosporum]KMT22046.1 sporulation protein YabP [Clostridium cylindrosporum DSM 605]